MEVTGCGLRTSILFTVYLFAISAIWCTIHRTYSKGDKQIVNAPGDQRNISMWVYVTFISNDPGKGIDYIPILFTALFMEFSYCPVLKDLICCHLTCPWAAVSSFR